MFTERTVLILGAGASAPYGFPLGDELLQRIVLGISEMVDDNALLSASDLDFLERPYASLRWYLQLRPPPFLERNFLHLGLAELRRDLSTSTRTIDEFARINPQWRDVLKMLVAFEIGRCLFERYPNSVDTMAVNRAITHPRTNSWYPGLVNELRSGARNAAELADGNHLVIVTFNYERSLEYYFELELGRGHIFAGFDFARAPEIIHVHGQVPFDVSPTTYYYSNDLFWTSLCRAKECFLMLDESRLPDGPANERRAHKALAEAKRIFVLGFDLHRQNVNLLNLADSDTVKKCVVLNWDGALRVTQRALALGVASADIIKGSRIAPLEISAAIDDGLFGM
jgi:hypothetical protein